MENIKFEKKNPVVFLVAGISLIIGNALSNSTMDQYIISQPTSASSMAELEARAPLNLYFYVKFKFKTAWNMKIFFP